MKDQIEKAIRESLAVKETLLRETVDIIASIADRIIEAVRSGNKIILFGNGGSAADAQHIAAEFLGRFLKERAAYPAIALTTNTSALTAIGNDYGYECTFVRQLEGLGKKRDVAIGISTSGNAPNVIRAIEKAKELDITTIGLTGGNGGKLAELCDISLIVPSTATPRIQEMHIMVGHIICEVVEDNLTEGCA